MSELTLEEWLALCPGNINATITDGWWDNSYPPDYYLHTLLRRGEDHRDPHEQPVTVVIIERERK